MMAKKKAKGPAAQALAALEALEKVDKGWDLDEEEEVPKKKQKKPKAGGQEALQAPAGQEAASVATAETKSRKSGQQGRSAGSQSREPDAAEELDQLEDTQGRLAIPDVSTAQKPDSPPAQETEAQEEESLETLEDQLRKTRPPPRIRISETTQPGHVSMRLQNIAVTFKNQEVLTDATWEVKTGDRIGLVGPNGGGKTTQMKILAGELEPSTGEVIKSSGSLRVAFLRQEFVDELVPTRTLKDEMLSVFHAESKVLEGLRSCEAELALPEIQSDPARMQNTLTRMADLQEEAQQLRVYDLGLKADKVMDLMGFLPQDAEVKVSSFSGGWRMRIGLGKILLQDPNILLLDEPTNHLDLESVEWLEAFLRNQNLPMVIVSHDREFLDRVCTKIVDTEGGVATAYEGNYSQFLRLKKERLSAWQSAYDNQQKKIREEKAWINSFRNKGQQAAAQVKSREKALEKLMASEEYIKKPPMVAKPFVFRFPPAPRLTQEVAELEGVTHGYGGNTLFQDVALLVEKGQRIAFLGPNGAGKSTLLRLVLGQEEARQGVCRLGSSVVANYFEQNQADALDLSKTVMETIEGASKEESYNELRKLLGQFMFKGDDVKKLVGQLSGGEKARVALCKMMLKPANFLVLDEPTNHLDIPAKEMLEEALQHYDGAVLLVSHDRYFVSQVANTICSLEDKSLTRYEGDYRYYLEQNDELLDKMEARYVEGSSGIRKAKVVALEEVQRPKKNFGGKAAGVSGRKDKGVKNAKRFAERVA